VRARNPRSNSSPHRDVVQRDVCRRALKELSKFRGTLATNLARWKHKRRGPIAAELCALIERAGGMGSDLDLFQATERDAWLTSSRSRKSCRSCIPCRYSSGSFCRSFCNSACPPRNLPCKSLPPESKTRFSCNPS